MRGKILVVDESAANRWMMAEACNEFEVFYGDSKEEALRLLHLHDDFDLILLDLDREHGDVETVVNTLQQQPGYQWIRPLILIHQDDWARKTSGLPCDSGQYIRKPVKPESLQLRLKNQLELSRIRQLAHETNTEHTLLLETILEQAPIGIALSHSDQPSHPSAEPQPIMNPMFLNITGRTPEELIALGWNQITHPDDREKNLSLFRDLKEGRIDGYQMEKRYIRPDGSIVWVDMTVSAFKDRQPLKHDHICLVQDITARKTVETALQESERSKRVLLSNLPGMAYRCLNDPDWTMELVSTGCYSLTGYTAENLINNRDLSFNDLILPEYRELLWRKWQRMLHQRKPFHHEYVIRTASGAHKWVLEMGQGILGVHGKVEALEGIIIDITDRKKQELQLREISEIDSLTGLYNRRKLETTLKEDSFRQAEGYRGLVLISLNKMNTLNLSYGYRYTEDLVRETAAILSAYTNTTCQLYQIAFDKLIFYCRDYREPHELAAFCNKLMKKLRGMNKLITTGCSIGGAEVDPSSQTADEMIQNALTAVEGVDPVHIFGYCLYDHELKQQTQKEAWIKEALLQVINDPSNPAFFLQYQPILNLKTNSLKGFEALARLRIPSLRRVSPEDFIDELMQCMNQSGISAQNLGLEITESFFSNEFHLINDRINALKEKGFSIAIDDFGTGYSSLSRERDLNVDCLKIDRSFINRLLQISPEEAITGDIISMAHKLGHSVIAEGVEHPQQMQYLLEHDCDMVQGYLISKPLDKNDALSFLKSYCP